MIKASELRIRNLVKHYDTFSDCYFEIISISEMECVMKGYSGEAKNFSVELIEQTLINGEFKGIDPIPLTEERMLDFGFELHSKTGQRNILCHTKYKGIKCEDCGNGEFAIYVNDNLIGFKRFVHDWQNLFYALTGEELKLQIG